KLAVTLQRLGRLDEAEACYRETIATEGKLIERWPGNGRLRMDRTTTRAALAMLRLGRGRNDEARTLVDQAAAELQAIANDNHMHEPSPDHYRSLAQAYRRLCATDLADAMDRRAREVGPRPRHHAFDSPDRGP